jgi:hypothetical protein
MGYFMSVTNTRRALGDEKAHRGSHHDLTNDRNPCVFRSDGVFGNHNAVIRVQSRSEQIGSHLRLAGLNEVVLRSRIPPGGGRFA